MQRAKVIEIFTSIQGEGLYVGEEQLFLRFYGCNLNCSFCDEKKKDLFSEYTSSEVIEKLTNEGKGIISLTGGEPLLQADFLKELLPALKEKGLKIYLETNGTLKDGLLKVLDYIDIISMDIKLPSSTGLGPYWKEHSDFLKESIRKEVFVKLVITPKTILSDIEEAIYIVKDIDKNIPFIIQPVSYNGNIEEVDLLPSFFNRVKKDLSAVKIIPQVHKILGVA